MHSQEAVGPRCDDMAEDKRKPTLADSFIANNNSWIVRPNTFKQIKDKMRLVHSPFVLDTAGSVRYGEIVRDIPDLIIREQKFARAPYDVTWIEFDFKNFWETVNERSADSSSDRRLGFLIDHDTAYVISDGGEIMPVAYDLHHPWEVEDQLRFADIAGVSRAQLDIFFWGSSYNKLSPEQQRELRNHHTARALPIHDKLMNNQKDVLSSVIGESYADMRNIIGILLLLNRPSLTEYIRDVPRGKGFHKGKLRQYMAHTVVTIHIDAKPTLRLVGTKADDDVEKRRHEVRRTWCHDEVYRKGTKNGCVHTWIPHPKYLNDEQRVHLNDREEIERDNWLCSQCGGHRWHRDPHMRGNSLKGFVNKGYRITT